MQTERNLLCSGGGKGANGACAPGVTVQGRHLEGLKYGILKFDRFWRIGIADSDILRSPNTRNTLPVLGAHSPTVSAPRLHTKRCVHKENYMI